MPFYEYECASCKFYTELMQKLSDAPLKKCPSCGKSSMKKLISAPVFRLKGGGWYETDFKSDKENKRNLAGADEAPEAKAPASAPAADAKAADSKPESKPAESASSSAAKTAKSGKAAAKPVTRAPARKPVAKSKAKAKVSKRRGR
ncbi:MAG TPA: zinc ribbon domain-containing protein [Steroidobacteraceae bacterium]|nr:zinc ribbon domain-containing protein [Steroidobacteraceae bacterium]